MKPNQVYLLIGVALFAWGLFHAYGAFTFNNYPPRFWMVLGFVVAFLAFWAAMLAARQRRLKGKGSHRSGPHDV